MSERDLSNEEGKVLSVSRGAKPANDIFDENFESKLDKYFTKETDQDAYGRYRRKPTLKVWRNGF